MEALGFWTILAVGTFEAAPSVLIGGASPSWSGKRSTELSVQDISDITTFSMNDSYLRGMEQVALAANPFDRVFIGGIPAMIYSHYYDRGVADAQQGFVGTLRTIFSGVDHELPIYA